MSVLNDTLERFGKKGTMSKGRLYKLANMCYTASRCHWTSIYAQYNGQVVVNLTKCLRILLYITYTLKSWKQLKTYFNTYKIFQLIFFNLYKSNNYF